MDVSPEVLERVHERIKNRFIVFEGIDGCGKGEIAGRMKKSFEDAGNGAITLVREPGGTAYGEAIRDVLLHKELSEQLSPVAETLLFFASRAQLLAQQLGKVAENGGTVISDRFLASTYAYQGGGNGVPKALIDTLDDCVIAQHYRPLVTIILDVPCRVARDRIRSKPADRMERHDEAFYQRVREGYLKLIGDGRRAVKMVDATGSRDDVWAQVCHTLADPALPVESNAFYSVRATAVFSGADPLAYFKLNPDFNRLI